MDVIKHSDSGSSRPLLPSLLTSKPPSLQVFKMSLPFDIIKKSGHEDRYIFEDTLIDDFLTAQVLRDFYFILSGQSYKVGQTYCKEFTRKSDLISECKNLIKIYIASPAVWKNVLAVDEEKRKEHEKREMFERKKKEELIKRKAIIAKKVEELSKLSRDEFEILQTAMEIANAYID
jgi:hypothetical protein